MFAVTAQDPVPVIEAYVGEYASGKSEISINRALELKKSSRQVTLVDLDTVEPFYTLRPLKHKLEKEGLHVIGASRENSFGLGETGAMLTPGARWALQNTGDIILDIGYGAYGARTLNLVEGADQSEYLKVLAVVNLMRPMTGSVDRIMEYINGLGKIDGIVANTHLGNDTTVDIVINGNQEIFKAAEELDIPIAYVAVDEKLKNYIKEEFLVPVKFIKRYMPEAIW